jgi:hypothetical protein
MDANASMPSKFNQSLPFCTPISSTACNLMGAAVILLLSSITQARHFHIGAACTGSQPTQLPSETIIRMFWFELHEAAG